MRIDEAIKHCEEVAEDRDETANLTPTEYEDYINSCRECAEEHRQLAEWLRELKELREQTRWIPCSERLPENDDDVLVTDDAGGLASVGIDYWFDNSLGFDSGRGRWWSSQNVTAWMPLPEPYKVESEVEK